MKNTAEIKTRIAGVRDTVKITKAMYAISAAKMPASMHALRNAKDYLTSAQAMMDAVASCKAAQDSPLFAEREGKKAYIVIAADKGLCGDYNERVLRCASDLIDPAQDEIYSVGYVAREHLRAKGIRSNTSFVHMMQNPLPQDAGRIADALMGEVLSGHLTSIHVVYTMANHLHDQHVVCERLLPLTPTEGEPVEVSAADLPELVRHYLKARLYVALCDASCALNYKRMTGMQQASNNGEEMLETLIAQYNHQRQERITGELNDAGGAKTAQEEDV